MSAAPEHLNLELGALAKPLSEQLSAQGVAFDAETIRHIELDALAISRLKVRGVVTYSAGNRLYDKIFKSVWAEARRAARSHPPQPTPSGSAHDVSSLGDGENGSSNASPSPLDAARHSSDPNSQPSAPGENR